MLTARWGRGGAAVRSGPSNRFLPCEQGTWPQPVGYGSLPGRRRSMGGAMLVILRVLLCWCIYSGQGDRSLPFVSELVVCAAYNLC